MHQQSLLTEAELMALVKEQYDNRPGTVDDFCAEIGVSRAYLNSAMIGKSRAGNGIALAMGYKKVVRYEPIKGGRRGIQTQQ